VHGCELAHRWNANAGAHAGVVEFGKEPTHFGGVVEVTGAKGNGPMTPHEEHYPRRPELDDRNGWGMIPFLLGIAAIALGGILILTSGS
jgi:hypothetical protein